MWSPSVCYMYPSVAPNMRGDFSIIFNYGTAFPNVGFAIVDPYVSPPPGYVTFRAAISR